MNWRRLQSGQEKSTQKNNAGFTIIELLVAVVIIGILAAIAAPSWTAYMNSRRVTTVNDAVLQAIQRAKTQARKEKLPYSISFRTQENVPQIAVHPATIDASDNSQTAAMANYWNLGDLGQELGVKANQVVLQTNLEDPNDRVDSGTFATVPNDSGNNNTTTDAIIIFDHTGELDEKEDTTTPDTDLIVRVGVPNNTGEPIESTIRCIRVQTLLGSLVIGREESDCQSP